MGLTEKYAFRDDMISRLHDDLIGPRGGTDEVIDESPLDRYIAGVLWPGDSGTQDAVPVEPDDGRDDDTTQDDPPVAQARMRFPSSMGMTFTVDTSRSASVVLRPSAAKYLPGDELPDAPTDQMSPREDPASDGLDPGPARHGRGDGPPGHARHHQGRRGGGPRAFRPRPGPDWSAGDGHRVAAQQEARGDRPPGRAQLVSRHRSRRSPRPRPSSTAARAGSTRTAIWRRARCCTATPAPLPPATDAPRPGT